MLTPEKKIKLFVAAIDEDYKNRRNASIAEIEADSERALEKAKADAEKLCNDMIAAETVKVITESKRAVSERERELRLARMKKREAIRSAVFDKAQQALKEFSSSVQYDAYLEKCAEKAATAFPGEPVKVFVRHEDIGRESIVLPHFPDGSVLSEDSNIRLGGIRVLCEKLSSTADNTLDCALRQEEEDFLSSSGLTL